MTFLNDVRVRAAAAQRRIVFPETADDRTRAAIATLKAQRIVEPIAVLDPKAPASHGAVRALGVETLDPAHDPFAERAADLLLARRSSKGLTGPTASGLGRDPLFFADALV